MAAAALPAAADRHHDWNQRAIYTNLVHMHESLVRDTSDNEFFFMTVRADVAAGALLLLELVRVVFDFLLHRAAAIALDWSHLRN